MRRTAPRSAPALPTCRRAWERTFIPDLSIRENIEFFGRVFGQSRSERNWRIGELLVSTGLAPFADRPTKKLSGGMRQKLGLCCSLIHDPDLLILDEPTTGVDPLSRRQFWELIDRIRARRVGMSVVVATAYMEEAERFDSLIAMNDGKILAVGSPADLKARTNTQHIEDAFVALMPEERRAGRQKLEIPPRRVDDHEIVITARDLTCRFGDFTAVDRVSFSIERGEIFGFVGSNGCGKTTTMKMLTGLLTPSEGEALLFGTALDARDINSRRRVGYMSQSFSLYTELTVRQNLELHARLFHLPAHKARTRLRWLIEQFRLTDYLDQLASALPLGIRQRLSLAVAVVHEPEMLILDEPTSGVDPLARDPFWELLIDLSRNQGVTIFVSTHFMNEAERCDRISLMDSGRVLATDTPANLVKARGAATLEDAFISYLEAATGRLAAGDGCECVRPLGRMRSRGRRRGSARSACSAFPPTRFAKRSSFCAIPIRLGFAFFGIAFLMLVFGFGISNDVNNLTFAVLDHDNSHESRAYLEELRGSSYFVEKRAARQLRRPAEAPAKRRYRRRHRNPAGLRPRHRARTSGLGRRLGRRRHAVPRRDHPRISAGHASALSGGSRRSRPPNRRPRGRLPGSRSGTITIRISKASTPWCRRSCRMLLAIFPAILMALAIVREKELGSITNLYVTPVTRLEFLLGKQIPYVGVAVMNFLMMFADGAVCLSGAVERQLSSLVPRRRDICQCDDRLWHADFVVRQHADRRHIRHRRHDVSAGVAILRHAGAGFLAGDRRRSWGGCFR